MHLKISSSGAATHWAYRLGGAVFFTWQSLLVVSQCGDSGRCLSELLISSTSVPSQIIIMRSNYHYIITAWSRTLTSSSQILYVRERMWTPWYIRDFSPHPVNLIKQRSWCEHWTDADLTVHTVWVTKVHRQRNQTHYLIVCLDFAKWWSLTDPPIRLWLTDHSCVFTVHIPVCVCMRTSTSVYTPTPTGHQSLSSL